MKSRSFSLLFSIMYLISTELESDDILLFYDYYSIIGIDKKECHDKAFDKLASEIKQKIYAPLFLATRNFEKIYQLCIVSKLSKSKDLIFDNQINCINSNINTFLHVKTHIVTHTLQNPSLWKQSYIQPFSKHNTLYYIDPDSDFSKYLLFYIQSLLYANSDMIQYSSLTTIQPVHNMISNDIFILETSQKYNPVENISIGVNATYITPGSWIFLRHENEIYKLLHVTNVKHVQRINRQRFINCYFVLPFVDDWTVEIHIDMVINPSHFTNPTAWGLTKICYEVFSQTQFDLRKPIHSAYLQAYVNSFLNKRIPEDNNLSENEHYNYFQCKLPLIFQYERIYVLSSVVMKRLYSKIIINDEEIICLDLNPLMFFKTNVDKWDKAITKQFLEDVKNGIAQLFITTKKYKKFFMSINVTNIDKYKSKGEKLSSPYAWILDYKYNANIYGTYGVLPIMLKAKEMWNVNGQNFGYNVKHYNEISHVFQNNLEKELIMFSNKDIGDKLYMFKYLKSYLLYETFARFTNTFNCFTREEISTYSDVIEPQDYGMKLGSYIMI